MAIALTFVIFLLPLLLFKNTNLKLILFCLAGIFINVQPSGPIAALKSASFKIPDFSTRRPFFFAIIMAELFTSDKSPAMKKFASILLLVYLVFSLFTLHQNDYPWQEAGRLVENVKKSTDVLVESRRGEWGVSKTRILAFNVPADYIDTLIFLTGFPEMLKLRYPDELQDVQIEVTYSGLQTHVNLTRAEREAEEGAVVWLYLDAEQSFIEFDPDFVPPL